MCYKNLNHFLIQMYIPFLKEHEGCVLHPYLDSNGYLTTGYGSNISKKTDFLLFNWSLKNSPLSLQQKEDVWYLLQSKKIKKSLPAHKQHDFKVCFITHEEALKKALEYLHKVALPTIRKKCLSIHVPFDSLKQELQLVLLDMEYNMGGNFQLAKQQNKSKKVWLKLSNLLINQQWEQIPFEVHRKHVSKKRNEWAYQFLSKAFLKG